MWRGLKLAARILAKDRLFTIAVIALLAARAIAAAVACMVLFAVTGALAPSLRAARTQPSQVLREQ